MGTASTADNSSLEPKTNQQSNRRETEAQFRVKRLKAARLQAGEIQKQVKPPSNGGKTRRKSKRDTDAGTQMRKDELDAEQLYVESEASREFRISQMEIEEAVKAKDPSYELRQSGRVKKMPGLDRILIEQAFQERNKNMKSMAKHEGIELIQLD